MLLIQNLEKKYKEQLAIVGMNITIEDGEVIGLLGENGAGKTTLISLLTSIIKPSNGIIKLNEYEYGSQEYKQKIGVVFGGEVTLYERLTVKENLEFYGSLYGIKDSKNSIAKLSNILQFKNYENKRIEDLSRGMKQRVSLSLALIHDPELILLDEPTIGLDVTGQNIVQQLVKSLKANGKTIIYSTNIITEVEEFCDKVIIMHAGEIKEFETIENIEVKYQKELKEVFSDIIKGEKYGSNS